MHGVESGDGGVAGLLFTVVTRRRLRERGRLSVEADGRLDHPDLIVVLATVVAVRLHLHHEITVVFVVSQAMTVKRRSRRMDADVFAGLLS